METLFLALPYSMRGVLYCASKIIREGSSIPPQAPSMITSWLLVLFAVCFAVCVAFFGISYHAFKECINSYFCLNSFQLLLSKKVITSK